MKLRLLFAASLLLITPALNAQVKPLQLKIFILAGQSNMEGQAVVDLAGKDYNDGKGTLATLMSDPVKGPMFKHLKTADGKWTVRDDVCAISARVRRCSPGHLGLAIRSMEIPSISGWNSSSVM